MEQSKCMVCFYLQLSLYDVFHIISTILFMIGLKSHEYCKHVPEPEVSWQAADGLRLRYNVKVVQMVPNGISGFANVPSE